MKATAPRTRKAQTNHKRSSWRRGGSGSAGVGGSRSLSGHSRAAQRRKKGTRAALAAMMIGLPSVIGGVARYAKSGAKKRHATKNKMHAIPMGASSVGRSARSSSAQPHGMADT